MTAMRAKLQISSVTRHAASETLQLHGVSAKSYPADGADEDNTYAKFSPSVSMSITIANPALIGKFEPGQKFYLDFTVAD